MHPGSSGSDLLPEDFFVFLGESLAIRIKWSKITMGLDGQTVILYYF